MRRRRGGTRGWGRGRKSDDDEEREIMYFWVFFFFPGVGFLLLPVGFSFAGVCMSGVGFFGDGCLLGEW